MIHRRTKIMKYKENSKHFNNKMCNCGRNCQLKNKQNILICNVGVQMSHQ